MVKGDQKTQWNLWASCGVHPGNCQCRGLLPAKWRAARIECAAGRRSGPRLSRTLWFLMSVETLIWFWYRYWMILVGQICDIWFFWCFFFVLRTRAPSKGKAWLCCYSNKHGFVERQCVANGILGIWSFQAAPKQFSLSWVLAKSNEIQHTSVPKLFMSFSKFVAVFSLFFTDSRKSQHILDVWRASFAIVLVLGICALHISVVGALLPFFSPAISCVFSGALLVHTVTVIGRYTGYSIDIIHMHFYILLFYIYIYWVLGCP